MSSNPNPSELRVGFAGLGAMGCGMALNLVKAGFHVTGFDPSPHARKAFEAGGGLAATSIEDSCLDTSRYLIMVANSAQVDSLMFGPDGLVAHLPRDAIVCLCCTLSPDYVSELPSRISRLGRSDLKIVDCPVSGGMVGAVNGTLSIMMAGDSDAIDAMKPLFQAMANPDRMFFYGPLATASTLKMLNQHLAGIHVVAAAEILAFAKSLGLSTRTTFEAALKSPASSWILGDRGKHMLDCDWTTRSAVDIFVKDLGIVNDCADNVCFPCPVASEAYYSFLKTSARGFGRRDDAFVVSCYEDVTRLSVGDLESLHGAIPNGKFNPIPSKIKFMEGPNDSPEMRQLRESWSPRLLAHEQGHGITDITIYQWHSIPDHEADRQFASLAMESIVLVIGLHDITQVGEFVEENQQKYPHVTFINCQVIGPGEFSEMPQLLLSSENREAVEIVTDAFRPEFTCRHISGPFVSATLMSMVIKYGSIIHLAAAAECFGLTMAMGIEPNLVYTLAAGAAGSSYQFNKYFPAMMKGDEELHNEEYNSRCDNSFKRTFKDLRSLRATACELKFPATLLSAAHQMFKAAARRGVGEDASVASLVSS